MHSNIAKGCTCVVLITWETFCQSAMTTVLLGEQQQISRHLIKLEANSITSLTADSLTAVTAQGDGKTRVNDEQCLHSAHLINSTRSHQTLQRLFL